jgi:DNA gyrase subunit B
MPKDQIQSEYTAKEITVLEGLDPVRKRPGMYIGGTGIEGLHHLVWEIINNSIDEAMAGQADTVTVDLLDNNVVSIMDNGRGIPVDMHPTTGKSALETVMTILHAGGKFGGAGYKTSGGLHGVGISVVNALSVWTEVEVYKDGKTYSQKYERGKTANTLQEKNLPENEKDKSGTRVTFAPDPDIFERIEFNWDTILDYCRHQAYLTKGIHINVTDCRNGAQKPYYFYFEGGIISYVRHLNKNKIALSDTPFYVDKSIDDVNVEVSLAYTNDYNEHVFTFANNIFNPEGGTHLTGFRSALTRVINDYVKKINNVKDNIILSGDDVREGLTAVISVKLRDPQFEGQTKAKLGNPEIRSIVENVTASGLSYYFEENPNEGKKIIEKCTLSARARLAAKAARETVIRKGALEGMTLPGKLADCSSRNPAESEIYIVEGNSAGGCFSGDTKVALADGRNLSFIELISENKMGKINYCYTVNNKNEIKIAQIKNPRLTKKQTKVIKITLDNGEEIICTPNHKFMVRNGSYLEAKDLKPTISLMPLNRKISVIENRITIEGYEMVLNPATHKWIFTHMLADQYNLENNKYIAAIGQHRHHADFNKLNNSPENIIRISSKSHLEIHRQHISKTLHRPEVIEKCRKLKQDPKFKLKMSEIIRGKYSQFLSEKAKKQWENENYKKYMSKKFMEFYHSNEVYRIKNKEKLNKEQQKYWSSKSNRQLQSEKIRQFYLDHPEAKAISSDLAKKQWENNSLLIWRKQETSKQWTDEFRMKRKASYDLTYLKNSMEFARKVYDETGEIEEYEIYRKNLPKSNENILSCNTLINRFFSGDYINALEAVKNYNHKIKSIEYINEKIDVYDLEVPKTHNFALASGVFVHNSAKQARDRRFQAILPLRGKILNVERARLDRMLSSAEIKALIVAIGCGIGDEIDYTKLRYSRVIIMTDADVDGSHIRTLLLTFLYRNFPKLFSDGNIYIAQPPLFAISKGKEKHYAFSDEERNAIISKISAKKNENQLQPADAEEKTEEDSTEEEIPVDEQSQELIEEEMPAETKSEGLKGVTIQRYKGLGEMNAVQLWETTLDPENRVLVQVSINEAEKADQVFSMLMGEEVLPRKKFIQTHARYVKNLDI